MRLRISTRTEGPTTVIEVVGELRSSGISELERLCRETPHPLALDLSNVRWIDASGADVIRALTEGGVELMSVPPYIGLLLGKGEG